MDLNSSLPSVDYGWDFMSVSDRFPPHNAGPAESSSLRQTNAYRHNESFQQMTPAGPPANGAYSLGNTRVQSSEDIDMGVEGSSHHGRHEPPLGSRSPATRSSRRIKYGNVDWERHKEELRTLYLKNDKSLDDIIAIMTKKHSFPKSEKLYKEKFKAWGWRKNLSGPVASWMTQKADQRKRDSGKDTVFSYGGLQWNTSQAQKSASRSKKARTEIISVETPAEVTYTTPRDNVLSPRNALPAGESNKQSLELIVLSDTEDDSSGSEHDVPILPTSWHGYTISDVVAVFASARRSAGQGNPEKAIADFSTALEGYQHLLGPTHEDTAKVAFAMASFYTEQNRSTDADQIIQDICRSYIVKFGIEHRRTQQLIMQIVELLTGWNRDDDASTFLTRVEELEEGSPDRFASLSTQRRSRKRKSRARSKASRSQPTALSSMLTDEAQEMIAENDPARITRGLEMVRVHVAAKNEAVESFLITIIDHCWHRPNFEIQAIRARGELLKYYNKLLNRTERRAAFLNAAQASMDVIIWQNWDKKFFKSFEVMEALLELGACILKGGYGAEAANIFRAVELKAEDSFGWDQERTLWAKLTIGIIYQRYSGWEAAKLWFEYALAASVAANGEEDGITIALETAMENHRFSYLSDEGRPFKSIFGVCGVVIRPSRLHLD